MTITADTLSDASLWQRARASFARAVIALGDAAAIASLKLLTPALRRDIIRWLCPLENVVRKLLFAEAAALYSAERARIARGPRLVHVPLRPPVWTGGLPARIGTAVPVRCEPGGSRSNLPTSRSNFDLSRPETWSARFSLAPPRDPHAVSDAHAPRIRALWGPSPPPNHSSASLSDAAPARVIDPEDAAFRLARRFEALRRVLENPRPHIERLARLLGRAIRRFPEFAIRFAMAPARAAGYDARDPRLGIDATASALDARFALDTS